MKKRYKTHQIVAAGGALFMTKGTTMFVAGIQRRVEVKCILYPQAFNAVSNLSYFPRVVRLALLDCEVNFTCQRLVQRFPTCINLQHS